MSYKLTGTITDIFETQQVTDTFRKREFVVEVVDGEYPELIKLQLINDKCDLLNNFTEGEEVDVSFNIKGRKWTKDDKVNYFTNLDAWRIEKVGADPVKEKAEDYEDSDSEILPF